MKKNYILFILLVITGNISAQITWGPPFPLTDSLTNNVNATLSIVPGEMFQPDTLYMLWERTSDPSSTGIYARNLTTMAGPFMVAAQLNVHFRHPRVFSRGTGDTLFYFSYETDMNGTWDLYYSKFLKNEVALGPFPFICSSQNERSLNWGDPMIFSWEKEGNIFVKEFYSDTVHLASDSCYNPVQSGQWYVAYEMTLGQETGVFFSKYDNASHLWTGPFPMDIYGLNTHLTFGNDSYSQQMSSYIFWQHKNGSFWVLKGFDLSDNQYLSFNNFAGFNNISPSFCYINMITDHAIPPLMHFSTFASDVTGNLEIYVNNTWGDTIYSNISGYSGTDTHPQLFNNFHHYGWGLDNQLFDMWESYRGGHWQLWGTTMDILTGEKTLGAPASRMVTSSPNPFTYQTRIEYTVRKGGPVSAEIYDLTGKRIKTLNSFAGGVGKHSFTWDGDNAAGVSVPAGIYVCKLKTYETVLSCKIIRR
jgi:hypothetical protein